MTTTTTAVAGANFYSRCALAGALSCSVTHCLLLPVDAVKTRTPLLPTASSGAVDFRPVVWTPSTSLLKVSGSGPTAANNFAQGALKVGGYEFWKQQAIETVGVDTATSYRPLVYLASAGIAGLLADLVSYPFDQTAARGRAGRGLYSGFGALLRRQVPYMQGQFTGYELASEALYSAIDTQRGDLSSATVTGISLASGFCGGIAAAVMSQPAHTLPHRSVFAGLGTRMIMAGILTAGQFGIYDEVRRVLTSGYEVAQMKTG
ncbi:mitochondrial phosphate carrier protein [Sorochytrium milnesiophthora]